MRGSVTPTFIFKFYSLAIIHRDIKPANILIKKNIFKLADFGFAIS